MPVRPPRGTQSIQRAAQLLKALGTRKGIGWRITDLARHCELDVSTTHRILNSLTAAGLARQRSQDRRYVPGPLVFELSLTVPAYAAFQQACRRHLQLLARKSGLVATLHLRSGDESVCIDRAGRTPVQLMIETGTRRPLGHIAHGVAILMTLPRAEQSAILRRNRELSAATPERMRGFRKIQRQSRRLGAGLSLGDVVPGIAGLAVPLYDASGRAFGSIGLTGPTDEFTPELIAAGRHWLEEQARRIEIEQQHQITDLGTAG